MMLPLQLKQLITWLSKDRFQNQQQNTENKKKKHNSELTKKKTNKVIRYYFL